MIASMQTASFAGLFAHILLTGILFAEFLLPVDLAHLSVERPEVV